MAFRVGVVGHRPDRLPRDAAGLDAIRARIAEVLSAVAEAVARFSTSPDAGLYSPEPPLLRANSPLAEGADRLFAEEALRLGYELCCIMPFAQAAFEEDFVPPESVHPDALAEFRALLERARGAGGLELFELDGRRSHRPEAYEAAGRLVLNQSDLLVVIWDGGAPNGAGGTVDTLRQAVEFNVPALWIDARAPHGWRLLTAPSDLEGLNLGNAAAAAKAGNDGADAPRLSEVVAALVDAELGVPGATVGAEGVAEARAHLWDYLREAKPRVNLAFVWKLFRDLWDTGVVRMPTLRVPDYVGQISADWPVGDLSDPAAPDHGASWINNALRAHYAWSDKLADRYADAHRSAFVWTSLLAAAAVFVALLPMASAWEHRPRLAELTAILEGLILGSMVLLPFMARRRRWHQRWTEYRPLAELIRELKVLIPLGGGRPLPRTSAHLASYGDPTRTWMYWQVRAIARATGLPSAKATPAYVAGQLADLARVVGVAAETGGRPVGQIGFHDMTWMRMARIDRHLHRATLILFVLTLVGVSAHGLTPMVTGDEPPWFGRWIVLIAAFFPALGAALASINNQGEFTRLQNRSRAMTKGFAGLQARLIALRETPGGATLGQVTDLATRMTAMMVEENIDWRIVVLDVPHGPG